MAIKQKEQQFCMLRAQLLPGLVYRNTEREAETVDIYINGRGVQDKTASVSGRLSLQFNVHKHLGQGKKGPYEVGDFEFLWVNSARPEKGSTSSVQRNWNVVKF